MCWRKYWKKFLWNILQTARRSRQTWKMRFAKRKVNGMRTSWIWRYVCTLDSRALLFSRAIFRKPNLPLGAEMFYDRLKSYIKYHFRSLLPFSKHQSSLKYLFAKSLIYQSSQIFFMNHKADFFVEIFSNSFNILNGNFN